MMKKKLLLCIALGTALAACSGSQKKGGGLEKKTYWMWLSAS